MDLVLCVSVYTYALVSGGELQYADVQKFITACGLLRVFRPLHGKKDAYASFYAISVCRTTSLGGGGGLISSNLKKYQRQCPV